MSKFTDNLWSDLVREHGAVLAHADRPAPGRARLRGPRVLAGGTLGLAGIGTALLLILGGTAATTPAFAITTKGDGSVLVKLNYVEHLNLAQLDASLAAKGIHQSVSIDMATGPATVHGAVTCTPGPGVSGPAVRVLVGANGTEVIGPGQSGDNTAEGSFHLVRCTSDATGPGTGGNTGTAG